MRSVSWWNPLRMFCRRFCSDAIWLTRFSSLLSGGAGVGGDDDVGDRFLLMGSNTSLLSSSCGTYFYREGGSFLVYAYTRKR